MSFATAWKKLMPWQLNAAIQTFSLISTLFEGYDQGVMSGVNAAPAYAREVKIGNYPSGLITDTTKQGGIVSIVRQAYLLCEDWIQRSRQAVLSWAIVGCFMGGWAADRVGRINGLFNAAIFAVIGGALQAASQNASFIPVARVMTGVGTGALIGITPVLVSETSRAEHRGGFLVYVFIANYLGISVVYWLSFGLAFVDDGLSQLRWRFLLGFQCVPAIVLLCGIKFLPDSPRYLASVGRFSEAKEVLFRICGSDSGAVQREFHEICVVSRNTETTSPVEFVKILLGLDQSLVTHLGRRAWLCLWLQIMASWTGITAVTAYSPVFLSQAGYSTMKQNGLAGGLNTIGIVGTIISAHVVDHFGRRKCFIWGAFGLFVVNLVAAAL